MAHARTRETARELPCLANDSIRKTGRTYDMTPPRPPVPPWQRSFHEHVDPHGRGSALSDVILGAQDAIVNILGVLLGIAAASDSRRLVLAGGLAAAFAESISMAAVAYTTRVAQGDVYRSERDREYRHVSTVPSVEREEVRDLYARKGFEGELLDRIVARITADPDVWVAVMMTEEHGLAPLDRHGALRSAAIVGLASIVGSLLPVVPFMVVGTRTASWGAVCVAAGALFGVGVYKAHATKGRPWRSGLEMMAIGTASAFAGWVVGIFFR
jgi:VIT1/CCC1 family predicted Fe2+/Mn2+ transporter